jgi:hypothetical protein
MMPARDSGCLSRSLYVLLLLFILLVVGSAVANYAGLFILYQHDLWERLLTESHKINRPVIGVVAGFMALRSFLIVLAPGLCLALVFNLGLSRILGSKKEGRS